MRIFIFIAAVSSLICGILQNQPLAVLRKASTICLECIGIG